MVAIDAATLVTALDRNCDNHRQRLENYFLDNDTGSHFETFAGGGDGLVVRNRFTRADLLVLPCMGISIPALGMLELLEGKSRATARRLLADIPANVDLAGAPESILGDGSASWRAWELLRSIGFGPTGTSKLLARKRPRLIPILDGVVRCSVGLTSSHVGDWVWAWGIWNDTAANVAAEVRAIRDSATRHSGPGRLSLLRVLDVLLWTEHEALHTDCKKHGRPCPGSPLFLP